MGGTGRSARTNVVGGAGRRTRQLAQQAAGNTRGRGGRGALAGITINAPTREGRVAQGREGLRRQAANARRRAARAARG